MVNMYNSINMRKSSVIIVNYFPDRFYFFMEWYIPTLYLVFSVINVVHAYFVFQFSNAVIVGG